MFAAALTLAIMLQAPTSAPAQEPTDDAIAAIALPEAQLRGMLARTVFSTQTMAMGAFTLGIPEACAVTRPAFEQAVQTELPRWRANLIQAYRTTVPKDTLVAAAAGGLTNGSPLLLPHLSAIGSAMQLASEPVLKEAAALVLTSVMTKAGQADPSKVDKTKRMDEMKQAMADGSLFCGLQPTGGAN